MQKIKSNLGLIFISLITILYLWLACNLVINVEDVKALDLNEKGDFLAGIFSPLAFLWLVYGYLQQGQELKQNTTALKLQYQELANSVEQQRLLVETTQADLELTKKRELRQNILDTIEAQPFFHFEDFQILTFQKNPDGTSNGIFELNCQIKNSRAICRNIRFIIVDYSGNITLTVNVNYLNNDLTLSPKLALFLPYGNELENCGSFDVDIKIEYLDAYDNQQFQIIQLTIRRDYSKVGLAYDFLYFIKNKSFSS